VVIGRQVAAPVRGDQSEVIFDNGLELVFDIYVVTGGQNDDKRWL